MPILITGPTGRIGSLLARRLIEQGHKARGLVWPRDAVGMARLRRVIPDSSSLEIIEGSITNSEDCASACDGVEAIYHLGAAFQGGGPFTNDEYFEINLRGTFNMLEAAAKQSKLQHFAFASTDAVYNKYPPDGLTAPIREDEMPVAPEGWSRYGTSKAAGELLCRAAFHRDGVPVTIFRFCFVRDASEMLDWEQWRLRYWLEKVRAVLQPNPPTPIPRVLSDATREGGDAQLRFPSPYGGGGQGLGLEQTFRTLHSLWSGYEPLLMPKDAQGRPFQKHIADTRDIAQGLAKLLGRSEAVGETIQLAGPRPFTWHEIVPRLAKILGTHAVEATVAGIPPVHYEFDLSKAKRLLGFAPEYDIQRMVTEATGAREEKT